MCRLCKIIAFSKGKNKWQTFTLFIRGKYYPHLAFGYKWIMSFKSKLHTYGTLWSGKQQLIMQLALQTTNSFALVKINLKYILGWQNSKHGKFEIYQLARVIKRVAKTSYAMSRVYIYPDIYLQIYPSKRLTRPTTEVYHIQNSKYKKQLVK